MNSMLSGLLLRCRPWTPRRTFTTEKENEEKLEENSQIKLKPGLYVCGTPIGNLEDSSLRLLKILKHVDLICCEDTRQSKRLLERFNLGRRNLISFHDFSSPTKAQQIIENIEIHSQSVALLTDAGLHSRYCT